MGPATPTQQTKHHNRQSTTTGPEHTTVFCFFSQALRRFWYLYRYTHFYTAANVHFTIKRVLQITHTSLAIENSFMRSLVRGTNGPVFMLRETGTNEL